jgi:uncharacterized protein YkwD
MLALLLGMLLFNACASQTSGYSAYKPAKTKTADTQQALNTFQLSVPSHHATLTSQVTPQPTPSPLPTPTPIAAPKTTAGTIPGTGTGSSPYGAPSALTGEETTLTQQIFAVINSDRAARGLYAYTWNATLSGGARLHSWNMFHCGFSHTCPDGIAPCQRMTNEGFTHYTDCAENIAYAGPYPTAWGGVHSIQEGMINEPPSGFHHMHLVSTTLHTVGVGVYVDPSGYIWFTEDFLS